MLRRKPGTRLRAVTPVRRQQPPGRSRPQPPDSPPIIGATTADSTWGRLAFLVLQNPGGEFGRFLILGALAVMVLLLAVGLIIVVTDIRTAGWIALSVTTAAGGRVVYRRICARRTQ